MANPLTASQLAALRAELEQRRSALERQLDDHLHGTSRAERAADVASLDADDAPQRLPEREVAMALTDHERRELDAVTAALRRIDAARFGCCVDCGKAIPYPRLLAEPWALRCVGCEAAHESRQR